jgi:two-component system, OmpR family, response regulator BaeR
MNETGERHVLVVEDDPKIAHVLVDYLRAEGLSARHVVDGTLAVQEVRQSPPSAILLDLMLPGMDGIAVCRAIREFSDVPIVMLTARVDEVDRLLGLETGADDYVCKPFSPKEVMARIKAQIRRAHGRLVAQTMPWSVDEAGLRIAWRGQWLPLTPLEFRMLRLMLARPGRVFSRANLLEGVHDDLRDVSDRAIDSHVKNLRRKIQVIDPGCDCITSVYGVGYRFEVPPPEEASRTMRR